jgi:hypothetical protein
MKAAAMRQGTQAFVDLGDPERHAKILLEPWR